MIILISGTPGTGKTTVSRKLADRLDSLLVEINQLIKDKNLYYGIEPDKQYLEVNIEALKREQTRIVQREGDNYPWIIFEGHLSHYFKEADLVIILRTNPSVLKNRLQKRDWKENKINENIQSEVLDICTWEAHDIHGSKVQELDTSKIDVDGVVDTIIKIISGKETHPIGRVNFLDNIDVF
jgi:adenylate kinase